MKKKYIKPIIECCHFETTIMTSSLATKATAVDDSEANPNAPNGSNTGDNTPKTSKDNFWNLWEDDDMEFEL